MTSLKVIDEDIAAIQKITINAIEKIYIAGMTDGKSLFYPSDEEWNKLYDQIETVEIEESYTIAEWDEKFVVIGQQK